MTACTCKTCSCSEEEIAAFHKAFELPRPKKEIRTTDLEFLVGRIFSHDVCDVVSLLREATGWLDAQDLCLLHMSYSNSTEGGKYHESVTVIAESF